MRRARVFSVVVGLAGVLGVAAAVAATTIGWGKAIPVPGLRAISNGGAGVASVSCRSATNCTAGGYYYANGNGKPFVVDETAGVWGSATNVPGIGALANGGDGAVNSVSCGSAGNCAAGGSYYDTSTSQAFIADETAGVWGNAVEVPGTAALNTNGSAGVSAVSCSSAGNCGAGGYYDDASGYQAFVVDERNGVWGTAIPVPGLAALNAGNVSLTAISCRATSPGNCTAGGSYSDGSASQAFVVTEKNGVWGTAIEVPGTAWLNSAGDAAVSSVSCASAGNCSAGGHYRDGGGSQAFVVTEKNGIWSNAIEVPGTAALNAGGYAGVNSVACASAGNCAAGGYSRIQLTGNSIRAFVAVEKNGVWKNAISVPGSAALTSSYMSVSSVSCATAGNCLAGGMYVDGSGVPQAFVAPQRNGVWGNASEVPGTADIAVYGASVSSISCATSGRCSVAGVYAPDYSGYDVFVTAP